MDIICGIDMLSCERMAKSIESKSFYERVFSAREHALFQKRKNNIETITANFCVKEAFSKAVGIGISGFKLSEVYALRNESGAPYLVLEGKAKEIAKGYKFSVSISHDGGFAVAEVFGIKED